MKWGDVHFYISDVVKFNEGPPTDLSYIIYIDETSFGLLCSVREMDQIRREHVGSTLSSHYHTDFLLDVHDALLITQKPIAHVYQSYPRGVIYSLNIFSSRRLQGGVAA